MSKQFLCNNLRINRKKYEDSSFLRDKFALKFELNLFLEN